jgi:hypothetical protein
MSTIATEGSVMASEVLAASGVCLEYVYGEGTTIWDNMEAWGIVRTLAQGVSVPGRSFALAARTGAHPRQGQPWRLVVAG